MPPAACCLLDWCYACGYTKGLYGVPGRRVCDEKFRANTIAACSQHFTQSGRDMERCVSTADTMYNAVVAVQEGTLGKLSASAACPGGSSMLAAVDFCFSPAYEAPADVVASLQPRNGGKAAMSAFCCWLRVWDVRLKPLYI